MVARTPKEKRKVQISGKSSCMISLPKKWATEMGLSQGSALSITRHNTFSLLITAEKDTGDRSSSSTDEKAIVLSVPVSESPEATARKVSCLYVQGYNLIKVRLAENPLASLNKAALRELVRRQLIGVEIVSDSSDGLLLQILLGKSDLTIENAMKRMSIISSSMQEDAISSLKFLDKKRAHDLLEKDDIQRFGAYCSRQILGMISHDVFRDGGNGDLETSNLCTDLVITRWIQEVASCAREIAHQTITLEAPLSQRAIEALTQMSEFALESFDSAVLAFFKKDSRATERVLARVNEFSIIESAASAQVLGKSASSEGAVQIFAFAEVVYSLRNVVRLSGEIAKEVLHLVYQQFSMEDDGRTRVVPSDAFLSEELFVKS